MIANSKNGILKTLEISRDNSNACNLMLRDDFLKKPENYTLNIEKFIMNTTPPLNLIDEVMFAVLPMSDPNDLPDRLENYNEFRPTRYYTWLELSRQLNNWANTLQERFDTIDTEDEGDDNNFFEFKMNSTGTPQFEFKEYFLRGLLRVGDGFDVNVPGYYIEVGLETQKVLGLKPNLFFVTDGYETFSHDHEDGEQNLFDATQVDGFNVLVVGDVWDLEDEELIVEFPRQLNMFDQRFSLDIYSTFPTKSKISTLDGVENHQFLLFRIPYVDQHSFKSVTSLNRGDAVTGYMITKNITLKENLDVGATDYCLNQSETIHQLLLPGAIRAVNVFIRCRYLSDGVFQEIDIDFKNAFWYMKMVFCKKQT